MTMADASGMDTTNRRTVVGVFDDPNHAELALNELRDSGFSPDQVSVVARDTRASRDVVEHTGMGAETTGAGTGAFLGGVTGGILGWLLGIGALAIPGIGPIVAAGALATTLGGAAVGALAGGLIGGLVGMGVPEEEARDYEESVRAGRILLTVSANSDTQAEQAREIFDRHSGANVRAYGVGTTPEAGTTIVNTAAGANHNGDGHRGHVAAGAANGTLAGGATDAAVGAVAYAPPGAVAGAPAGEATGGVVGAGDPDRDSARRGDYADGSEGSATGSRTPR